MNAARLDLTIHDKNDEVLEYELVDASGTAVDITGYSFEIEFCQADTSTGAIAQVTGSIISAAAGTFRFVVPSATTGAFTVRRGVYEIRCTDTSGYIRTIVDGQFIFNYWGVA
jgi:hypothetical protein